MFLFQGHISINYKHLTWCMTCFLKALVFLSYCNLYIMKSFSGRVGSPSPQILYQKANGYYRSAILF